MHQIAQFCQKLSFPGWGRVLNIAPSSPNKFVAFFLVVAMNTDIFKLISPWILIKIHFKMHQIAPFLQKIPGERDNNPLS